MNTEVIDVTPSANFLMPVSQKDVTTLKTQRALLKKFIASQMKEANFRDKNAPDYGEGDYGIVPGTKKKSLLKPGAEKLLRLFGLGVRVKLVDKTIDKEANLAIFIYQAEVYHLRTGTVLAQCEGSTNSQETKYKERTVWVSKKATNGKVISESRKEETPIFDILNTLIKMAQKRAIVGATIIAVGASDNFTQDMEPDEEAVEKAKPTPPEELAEAPEQKPAPICCGKPMMISKYPDRESGEHPYYCIKCRKKEVNQ